MAAAGVFVLDIITEALSILGVYAPGEPIPAADSASLLFTLGGIVDGWGAEDFTIFGQVILPFTATPNKAMYTLGPAGDFAVTPLPPTITAIGQMIGALELPVEIVTGSQYAAIGIKTLATSITQKCWVQTGFPFHQLYFYPVPSVALPILIYADQQIARFTATSNVVSLPPGFQEAIVYELALKSAAKFGAEIRQWLPQAFLSAKTRIKEANFELLDAACDPALTSRGGRGGADLVRFYEGK